MPQLELFSRSQLATWRDPTASRNYSPEVISFAATTSRTANEAYGNVTAAER
jgi:hypothetical protein